MAKILFNITNGTGNPTKASLGFMLARTAVEEGHEVIAVSYTHLTLPTSHLV